MSIEDIINGKQSGFYPVKEFKNGAFTTRIQLGPEYKVTRTINFAGREIELRPLFESVEYEAPIRKPTVTTTLSPCGLSGSCEGYKGVKAWVNMKSW